MNLQFDNKINLADYKKLLRSANWKVLSDRQHQKALDNSMFLSVAKVDNNIVGIARLVGDYGTHGLLCDVVVLPEYQKKKIGRQLIQDIITQVSNFLDSDEQFLIELLPEYGKRDFYLNCGFKYKPENMDGMYLWIKK